ncbi:hypothetical protein SK128_018115, partial [Halocaridina rubra]
MAKIRFKHRFHVYPRSQRSHHFPICAALLYIHQIYPIKEGFGIREYPQIRTLYNSSYQTSRKHGWLSYPQLGEIPGEEESSAKPQKTKGLHIRHFPSYFPNTNQTK